MLGSLFIGILNMSINASYVVVAVLLARLLLARVPKVFSYALWGVVLLRLLCPFSFSSVLSLLPTTAQPIPATIAIVANPQINTGIPLLDNAVNPLLPAAVPHASVNPLQVWSFVGGVIWLCGIAVLLVYSIIMLVRLRRQLKGAVCLGSGVYQSPRLTTAFVTGAFRPHIYLPASLSALEREYILLHEQTHIRRLDHLLKLAGFVALCLHWFNPLVWLAFFLSSKDMEMSCDEAVIKKLGADVKKDYSSSLLTLATGRRIVGGSPLAFGEGDTKSRVKNVLDYKKPAFWVVVVAVASVLAVGIGLATNPVEKRPSMLWANNLETADIVSVELVVTPSDKNSAYRRYEPEQFAGIVKLVNESRGRYLPQPEPIAGGGQTLYITTTDGTRHSVANSGNVYLVIDGDSFVLGSWAVDAWGRYNEANAPIPEGFWEERSVDNYHGLSIEEYEELAAERARFESLTAEEQFVLLESGGVSCLKFEHLWWEDSISTELIRFVGADAFDDWAKAQWQQEQCSDIYSFAKQFGLDYPTLEGVIVENGLTDIYPLERLKARAAVFGVPQDGYAQYLEQLAALGITEEQARSLEAGGIPRETILTMTRDEVTQWLDEAARLHQENYDQSIQERFGANFLELAQSGEGAFYDLPNNRLEGRGQVEAFVQAVESKDTGGFVYFWDGAGPPVIYSFSVSSEDDFYTIERYRMDGTKESFTSKSAKKRETDYRFADDLADAGFPLDIPFGGE